MKNIFLICAICALSSCASLFTKPSIDPKSVYKIEQATFLSPNETGWVLMQNEIHSVVFAKKFDVQAQTAIISAIMYPAGQHKNSKAFFDFIIQERAKQDDKKRFKPIKVTNEFVTFKDLPCLKYQTLSEDHKDNRIDSKDFEYFKTSGYICRYPLEYIGFQIEVSHRSKEKEMPADLLKVGQEFFQNIELVEPTVKRLKTIP